MNQNYETTSAMANMIQIAVDAILKLDRELVEVPTDVNEITHDVQASIAKHLSGGK